MYFISHVDGTLVPTFLERLFELNSFVSDVVAACRNAQLRSYGVEDLPTKTKARQCGKRHKNVVYWYIHRHAENGVREVPVNWRS